MLGSKATLVQLALDEQVWLPVLHALFSKHEKLHSPSMHEATSTPRAASQSALEEHEMLDAPVQFTEMEQEEALGSVHVRVCPQLATEQTSALVGGWVSPGWLQVMVSQVTPATVKVWP